MAGKHQLARLLVVLLISTIQLFAVPSSAQASQTLVPNGDFSDGLNGWTAGALKPSRWGGSYPRWGIHATTPARSGENLFAFLDVPGASAAYLESTPFLLPYDGALGFTLWGMHDPVILQVLIKTQRGYYLLDSFDAPKVELGGQPVAKRYLIPVNFTGQAIAVRFTCEGVNQGDSQGVFCAYDDLTVGPATPVTQIQSTTTRTQPVQVVPAGSGSPGLLLLGIGLALGAAGAGVALAFREPRGSVYSWTRGSVYSCPVCGARGWSQWPFCRTCGAQLWSGNLCTRCGGHFPLTAWFCARCGLSRFGYGYSYR